MKYLLILLFVFAALAGLALFAFARAVFLAGRDRIVNHVLRYAGSYLVGAFFVALSLLEAFVAEFAHIPRGDRVAFDSFDWAIHWASAGAAALTVIIAFLNQTNSRDRAKPDPSSHETTPTPPNPAGAP